MQTVSLPVLKAGAHQTGQVVPLFDQGAPCRPHGRLGLRQHGLHDPTGGELL